MAISMQFFDRATGQLGPPVGGPPQPQDLLSQIDQLRGVTKMTRGIVEAQRYNLLYWPWAVDPKIPRPETGETPPGQEPMKCVVELGLPCDHQLKAAETLGPQAVARGAVCAVAACQNRINEPSITYRWRRPDLKPGWQPPAWYRTRLQAMADLAGRMIGPQFRFTVFMNDAQIYPFVSGPQSQKGNGRGRKKRSPGAKSKRVKRRTARKRARR